MSELETLSDNIMMRQHYRPGMSCCSGAEAEISADILIGNSVRGGVVRDSAVAMQYLFFPVVDEVLDPEIPWYLPFEQDDITEVNASSFRGSHGGIE